MDSVDKGNDYLVNRITNDLNKKQREAVTASPRGILQIIAGPGTGKTKVLISRVAYLLLYCNIPPQNIIVTTFTKKAANELVERLQLMLNDLSFNLNKLLVGTFHSICFRILKIYGKLIDKEGYSVASEKDSMQILQEVFSNLNNEDLNVLDNLSEEQKALLKVNAAGDHKYHGFDPKKFKRQISKLKSSGITPESYTKEKGYNKGIFLIYSGYQEKLTNDKLFDFDDCLLYTFQLISSFPVLNFVQHVLVDEFQDTNEIQLQLMYEFSKGHPSDAKWQNNLTIVGDPDQSIYAFRDAQSINFEKMKSYYERRNLVCNQITLEENYRSTSDILHFSENLMRQQSNRILKTLKSQKETSFIPVYKNLASSEEEARWIVYQIEFLLALPNTLFGFKDFSVLVRSAYQTRVIENELVRKKIPYHMIRGKAFWERKEVIGIMDYLRVIGNENDRIAYLRTLNFPKRGVGEKTISYIDGFLDDWLSSKKGSIFDALKFIIYSSKNEAKLTSKSKINLAGYLDLIEEARCHLVNANLNLEKLFNLVYSKSGIQHEFREDEDSILNILEVQRQLEEFEPREDDLPPFIGSSETVNEKIDSNILLEFVSSVGLYETESEKNSKSGSNNSEKDGSKVSLSTIHGSKGLEWSVVFVPGLSEGSLPASFAMNLNNKEEIDEERRCFYVAATRAKSLLYISSYTESSTIGKWGRKPVSEVSRFISDFGNKKKIATSQNSFRNWESLKDLYENKGGTIPNQANFDLKRFHSLYEMQLEQCLKGIFYDISKEDFNGLLDITKKFKPKYGGFTSAKSEIGTKKLKLSSSSESPMMKRPGNIKSSRADIRSFFKAPRRVDEKEVSSIKSNDNKAPSYTAFRNTVAGAIKRSFAPENKCINNDIPSRTLQSNRAPPYIPVRKTPSSFRRGNSLTKNSLNK